MKNFYVQMTKKISSLDQNDKRRTSWRGKCSSIIMGALMLAGAATANAQVSIGDGTTTTPNVPINANYGYNYSQQIYTQTEISALGEITSVSFMTNTSNPTSWSKSEEWVVYLGHTTKNTFTSGTDWVPLSEMTQVFSGVVAYPAETPGLVTVNFTTPFLYNNIDNLVIAIDENIALYGSSVAWSATVLMPFTNTKGIYYRSDSVNINPASPTTGFTTNTRADVVLGGITMSCPPPTNIVTSASTLTSTTISWSAADGTSSIGYGYEVRSSGIVGSGAAGLVTSGTTASDVLTKDITGLTPNSNYIVYVRSLCAGTDTSSWSTGTNLRTGYCVPSSTNATTYINSFTTTGGTATNISLLNSGYAPTGYQDNYTTQSVTTFPTSTFQFAYEIVGGSAGASIWIDYNNDLVFSESEKVFAPIGYQATGIRTGSYAIPSTVIPGEYRMRIKIDYNATVPNPCSAGDARSETEDYKIIILAQSLDAPDSATIGNFTAGLTASVVTSIQSCQSVEVSATVMEPGLTDLPGAAASITGWIGKSDTNTDPETWPESAWVLATYSTDQATGDLYIASFGSLSLGNKYFASRFRIGTGVYVFGGQNGLWNVSTNANATLEVNAVPAITLTTETPSICNLSTATLTVSTDNADYTYSWMPGNSTGASTTVTPSETTQYIVTATDSVTGCTKSAAITITVNPTPTAIAIIQEDMGICAGAIVELTSSSSTAPSEAQIGNATTATTAFQFPNPFSAWYGGVRNQMIYTKAELESIGLGVGSVINSIGFDIAAISGVKPCNDFTIKIGTTTESSLDGFVATSSLTTVYNQTFTPSTVGPVSFNFTAPYIWDGVSNLILEATNNAGNFGNGSGTTIKYSTTAQNMSFYGASDAISPPTAQALNTQTSYDVSSASNMRPNTTFGFIAAATVSWSPVDGLFTDAAATIAYVANADALTVYAQPSITTTYVASASTATCSVSDSVIVTVTTAPDAPTGVSPQTGSTIADLVISAGTTTWYASEDDAMTGDNPLAPTTSLTDGATYYAVNISGDCRSEVLAIVIDFSLDTQSYDFAALKYYPNPVADAVTISFSENIIAYAVFNMIGQQVLNAKVNATSTSVDMSALPSGSYMMQIQTANASKVIKLIKK